MYRCIRFSVLTLVLIALATPVFAGPGLQVGWSTSPDDFLIGSRFRSKPLGEAMFAVPSIEFGFGDVFMIAGNFDGHYTLKSDSKLAPYLGIGGTVNWFDYEGGSDTQFGGSLLGGVQLNEKFFFEAKYGLGDVPDWKFLVGWGR